MNSRLNNLRQEVARLELTGILISQPENMLYLSGFDGSDGYLFITSDKAVLATDFRYTEQVETGGAAGLAFSARVGDRELDGIDFLHFGPDGRINRMAVYVRPMSGIHALADAMQRKLEEAGAT